MNQDPAVKIAMMLAYPGSQAGPNTATVLGAEVTRLSEEVERLEKENVELKAKYKRDLAIHSCNSAGGPDMCGGCCECMERQFHNARGE